MSPPDETAPSPPSSRRRGRRRRKNRGPRKPKFIAVVGDECTGCAGSPMCEDFCPVDGCMVFGPDDAHDVFWRMRVVAELCIGCRQCAAGGSDGALLSGCPWEAIEMVPLAEWEAAHGPWHGGSEP